METMKGMMGFLQSNLVAFIVFVAALCFFSWEQVAGAAIFTLMIQWFSQGQDEVKKTMIGASLGALAFFAFGWVKVMWAGGVEFADAMVSIMGGFVAVLVMWLLGMAKSMVSDSD